MLASRLWHVKQVRQHIFWHFHMLILSRGNDAAASYMFRPLLPRAFFSSTLVLLFPSNHTIASTASTTKSPCRRPSAPSASARRRRGSGTLKNATLFLCRNC